MKTNITLNELFLAGAHFGHRTHHWCPKMAPYVFGKRAGIHIINLDHTLEAIERVFPMLADIYTQGNKILFVGTKRCARGAIKECAQALNMPHVTKRWLGGTLTNYKTIRRSVRRLIEIENQRDTGFFERITKKEALMKQREMENLEASIGGIRDMGGLPDALFVVDVDFERIAVAEATRLGIPVVGLVDTNSNPELVSQAIPINDDSAKTISLLVSTLQHTCEEAKQKMANASQSNENKEEKG